MGHAEIVEVDELALPYDRVVSFVACDCKPVSRVQSLFSSPDRFSSYDQTNTVGMMNVAPVIGESAVMRLGGNEGIRNGPTTRVGMILMKSRLFSSANFHAACSASVLDTKYICPHITDQKITTNTSQKDKSASVV